MLLYGLLSVVLLLLPLVFSVIFFPFFSLFGQGDMRASVVHAPGTAYFVSFYCFHSFLYSGTLGLIHLLTFLLAIYYVVSTRLRQLGFEKGGYTVPATVFFLLIVGLFGWVTSGTYRGGAKRFLKATQIFTKKTTANRVLPFRDKLITFHDSGNWLMITSRNSGKQLGYVKLGYKFTGKLSSSDVMFAAKGARITGDTLYLQSYGRPLRDKETWWYIGGYAISLTKYKLIRRWQKRSGTKVYPISTFGRGKDAMQLFYESGSGSLPAYSTHGKLLWRRKHAIGGNGKGWQASGNAFIPVNDHFNKLRGSTSMALTAIAKAAKRGVLIAFDPQQGQGTAFDACSGRPLKKPSYAAKGAIRGAGPGKVLLPGKPTASRMHPDFAYGYYEDALRFYGAAQGAFYGNEKKQGKRLWSARLLKYDTNYVFPAKDLFYLVRGHSSKHEVTVLLIDKESGAIRGRWQIEGYTLEDAYLGEDGALFLALRHAKDSAKSRVLALRFE